MSLDKIVMQLKMLVVLGVDGREVRCRVTCGVTCGDTLSRVVCNRTDVFSHDVGYQRLTVSS